MQKDLVQISENELIYNINRLLISPIYQDLQNRLKESIAKKA
jgi:hypothetical protein